MYFIQENKPWMDCVTKEKFIQEVGTIISHIQEREDETVYHMKTVGLESGMIVLPKYKELAKEFTTKGGETSETIKHGTSSPVHGKTQEHPK